MSEPGVSEHERIALVTGASRGIGRAAAVALAATGVHTVLTATSQGGLEETDDLVRAAGGTASLLPLDLTDSPALDMLGPSLHARFGRLDMLVHAAGILGVLTPVPHFMPKDWTRAAAVNIEATWRLIRTLDPLLRAAPAGRVVALTDRRASEPRAYWGMYGATKAAAEHLLLTWAEETRQTPLRINLFDPGPVATRLRATALPGEDRTALTQPHQVAAPIVALLQPGVIATGVIHRQGLQQAA